MEIFAICAGMIAFIYVVKAVLDLIRFARG